MRNNSSVIYNFFLIVGDVIGLTIAFILAYILRVSISHRVLSTPVHARTYLAISLTLLPFWILLFALLGLYNARYYEKRFTEFGRLAIGSFIGVLFAISYAYWANDSLFPARLVTVYDFGLALFFVSFVRTILRGIRKELFSFNIGINNVLIVGDTHLTHVLIESLAHTAVTGYRVVSVVGGSKHPHNKSQDYRIHASFLEAVTIHPSEQLHTIIQTELFADSEKNDEVLTYAQEHHIAYRFVPGNSELFVGNIEVDLFHSVPIIAVHQTALVGWGRVAKRLFDIVVGGLLLVLVSPLLLVIAVAEKLSDGGPVFFRQERLSRFDSKIFIFKFRSNKLAYNGLSPEQAFTKMGHPEYIQQYRDNGDHLQNDPRVSRFGYFLRRTSIDELPQLFNVVRGDISLVGPRALVAYELDRFPQKNLILSVKSGLTGLAQISGVRDLSFEERRQLDLYYVQNWRFGSDVVILLKTVWVVLFHKGTRA
jgi:exopolysaccharide biosynthesis polyprenyl glycosylphosphotransferase